MSDKLEHSRFEMFLKSFVIENALREVNDEPYPHWRI